MKKSLALFTVLILITIFPGMSALAKNKGIPAVDSKTTKNAEKTESPGRVFTNYYLAVGARNFDKMLSCLGKSSRIQYEKLDQNRREDVLNMLNSQLPAEYEPSGMISGKDSAVMRLTGTCANGKKMFGKVFFNKEEGQWKIMMDQWDTKPIP